MKHDYLFKSKSNEKPLEARIKREVEKQGGLCIKLFSQWFTGLPDRMILMPAGRIYFVEMKSTGRNPSGRQKIVFETFQRLGFTVHVIDTDELIDNFIRHIADA